jgi:hypothetical protein
LDERIALLSRAPRACFPGVPFSAVIENPTSAAKFAALVANKAGFKRTHDGFACTDLQLLLRAKMRFNDKLPARSDRLIFQGSTDPATKLWRSPAIPFAFRLNVVLQFSQQSAIPSKAALTRQSSAILAALTQKFPAIADAYDEVDCIVQASSAHVALAIYNQKLLRELHDAGSQAFSGLNAPAVPVLDEAGRTFCQITSVFAPAFHASYSPFRKPVTDSSALYFLSFNLPPRADDIAVWNARMREQFSPLIHAADHADSRSFDDFVVKSWLASTAGADSTAVRVHIFAGKAGLKQYSIRTPTLFVSFVVDKEIADDALFAFYDLVGPDNVASRREVDPKSDQERFVCLVCGSCSHGYEACTLLPPPAPKPPQPAAAAEECRNFLHSGYCRFGNSCRFAHRALHPRSAPSATAVPPKAQALAQPVRPSAAAGGAVEPTAVAPARTAAPAGPERPAVAALQAAASSAVESAAAAPAPAPAALEPPTPARAGGANPAAASPTALSGLAATYADVVAAADNSSGAPPSPLGSEPWQPAPGRRSRSSKRLKPDLGSTTPPSPLLAPGPASVDMNLSS